MRVGSKQGNGGLVCKLVAPGARGASSYCQFFAPCWGSRGVLFLLRVCWCVVDILKAHKPQLPSLYTQAPKQRGHTLHPSVCVPAAVLAPSSPSPLITAHFNGHCQPGGPVATADHQGEPRDGAAHVLSGPWLLALLR